MTLEHERDLRFVARLVAQQIIGHYRRIAFRLVFLGVAVIVGLAIPDYLFDLMMPA